MRRSRHNLLSVPRSLDFNLHFRLHLRWCPRTSIEVEALVDDEKQIDVCLCLLMEILWFTDFRRLNDRSAHCCVYLGETCGMRKRVGDFGEK